MRRWPLLLVALSSCIGWLPPHEPASTEPEVAAVMAAWARAGKPRKGCDPRDLRVAYLGEEDFRRMCGYCGPGFCRPEDYAPLRYTDDDVIDVPLCAHVFHRFATCAAGCYAARAGGQIWNIGSENLAVIHENNTPAQRSSLLVHETLHWLRDCALGSPDSDHRDAEIWGRNGIEGAAKGQ